MNYIVLSIPVFFILIGVELIISRLQDSHLYRFNDAVSNISCGIMQQITGALAKTVSDRRVYLPVRSLSHV